MSGTDLQTVVARFLPELSAGSSLSPRQWQVCAHLRDCRTEAMGVQLQACDHCDYQTPRYLACRDRHCPKCQGRACAQWCAAQSERLLPVTYYHLVFTLPHTLNPWVQRIPKLIYDQLFASVWATLATFAADQRRYGGRLGASLVLHTWGQTLTQHVHLHGLIPGGVWTPGGHWRAAKGNYLFPVKALSRHLRGHFVAALRKHADADDLPGLTPAAIDEMLDQLMAVDWVVYAKACFGNPETVVAYLSRYTHRTALSDQRLIGIDDDRVGLRYKDYRDDRSKVLWLHGAELLRRFLLHVLPKGLMRIRHYGLLANCCRAKRLAQISEYMQRRLSRPTKGNRIASPLASLSPGNWTPICPRCKSGVLHLIPLLTVPRLEAG
jgi:hypothetical protein